MAKTTVQKRNPPSRKLEVEKSALIRVFDAPGMWTLTDPNGRITRLFVIATMPFRFRRIVAKLVPHPEVRRDAAE